MTRLTIRKKVSAGELWAGQCAERLSSCLRLVPTSKTYILRNILDSELVKLATTPDNALLTAEIAEVQDATARSRINGTLLSWKSQEEIHLLGILQLILSLILVSGRSMTDGRYHLHFISCILLTSYYSSLEASDWEFRPCSQ